MLVHRGAVVLTTIFGFAIPSHLFDTCALGELYLLEPNECIGIYTHIGD